MEEEEKKYIKYKIPDEDKNTVFEKTDEKIWIFSNFFVVFLILLSIAIAFIATIPNLEKSYFFTLFILDFIISTLFAWEYFYRLKHSKHKKKFPFRILNIFDLLSFLPFFIIIIIKWITIIPLLALFRIFRIFRIIELFEKIPITKRFLKWLAKHSKELIVGNFIIFFILIIFSSLIYLAENYWWNWKVFSSLPKTIWWWIYALTTSGDAWMIPTTPIWRIISGILMVLWPILISILSSIIVLIFLDSTSMIELKKKKHKKIKCPKCRTKNSYKSNFCKKCWEKLKD